MQNVRNAIHNLRVKNKKEIAVLSKYLAMRSLLPRSTLPIGAPTP